MYVSARWSEFDSKFDGFVVRVFRPIMYFMFGDEFGVRRQRALHVSDVASRVTRK